MVMEDLFIVMEMFIKEIGSMIKHMDTEYLKTLEDQHIKDNGLKINSMEKDQKFGQISHCMKEIIKMDRNVDKENLLGKMEVVMKANFQTIL